MWYYELLWLRVRCNWPHHSSLFRSPTQQSTPAWRAWRRGWWGSMTWSWSLCRSPSRPLCSTTSCRHMSGLVLVKHFIHVRFLQWTKNKNPVTIDAIDKRKDQYSFDTGLSSLETGRSFSDDTSCQWSENIIARKLSTISHSIAKLNYTCSL